MMGANGAGKSTLLRCLLGVLEPGEGSVRVLGLDPLAASREIRERTGFVPDVPDAEPWMTAAMLFDFLRPSYPTWQDGEARRLAELFRVPLRTPFRHLSRGEGMKAMIAAALAPDPELVLLDEPFAGLDPLAAEGVLRAILGEVRTGRRTVLCATHDLDVAARIADDVLILHEGRIARQGALEDVMDGASGRAPARLRHAMAAAGSPGRSEIHS
jgi:ABC-2 type transport system ATP-binding protein